MKRIHLAPIPALVSLAWICGCSSEAGIPSATATTESTSEALTACPTPDASDAQERAAASVAFTLMKLAAVQAQADGNLLAARSILAAQRYTYQSGTTCYSWGCTSAGIQFDPSDPLYSHVSNAMKAALAFAQYGDSPTDSSSLGFYLANGLWNAQVFTDGKVYPSIFAIPALAQFAAGKSTTVHLADSNSSTNSHYVTMSGSPWCGTLDVSLAETVNESLAYAPLAFNDITDWRSAPSAYVGVTGGKANGQTISNAHEPKTPFMGQIGSNPYLLVSINGKPQNWAYESWSPVNCWDNPGYNCSSAMEIDPIPYTQVGAYYDQNNNLVGPQPNPFGLVSTSLYADPSHAGQWATRTVNNTQEWGTFSQAVTLFGQTEYKYVKQY